MHDVIVVGGGFAGVTAARESALRGRDVLLLEARDRLGGRTWSKPWGGTRIELGGAWVHWHQPHTFSELTRAGLDVRISDGTEHAGWYVGEQRRSGTIEQRDEIARRGWDAFVDGVDAALPLPHAPLTALGELARFDRMTIAQRLDQLSLSDEERAVLTAELESLAHAPLDDAGAVAGAPLARAVGRQPRADPADRRPGDDRRRHRSTARRDRRRGAVRGGARDAGRGRQRGRRPRRGDDPRRKRACGAGRGRGRTAERARRDRVRAGARGGQASRDRARSGLARDQGDDPRPRRAGAAELDPSRSSVRLPGERGADGRRHAAADRLRP